MQRIVYAESEMNSCARCQTDGKLLVDRSLSGRPTGEELQQFLVAARSRIGLDIADRT